jgi:hypothetical protein
MNDTDRSNPYPLYGTNERIVGWKWRDENGVPCERVYNAEDRALFALLTYMKHMPWWKRVWLRLQGKS